MKWDFGKDNWKSFGDTSWNEHAKTYTLVDEAPEHNGRVWSRRKFKRTSWVMEWALKVKGEGTGVTDNLVGSGIALWITTSREKPGGLYGSTDKFNGVGIFFDSFDNDDKKDNPIIMGAEVSIPRLQWTHSCWCGRTMAQCNSTPRLIIERTALGGEDAVMVVLSGCLKCWRA